ncbi:MAG: hypothetical protein ISS77_05735 [Phycisphaerae bacterium]|nr:hypothetical protein [Phycisphaerae bacterium]
MFNYLLASSTTLLAAATPEASQPNTWGPLINIGFGFILGLAGTGIIGLVKSCIKKRRFCVAASSELKQLLGALVGSCVFHSDSEIDEKKVKFCFGAERKYKFVEVLFPEGEQYINESFRNAAKAVQSKDISQGHIDDFVKTHNLRKNQRKLSNILTPLHDVTCRFINENLEIVSSLKQSKMRRILCIVDRVGVINHLIDKLSRHSNATFDSTLSSENYDRNRNNYYGTCQLISNFAYETSIEIDALLNIL